MICGAHTRHFYSSCIHQAIREAANRICKAIDQIGGSVKKDCMALKRSQKLCNNCRLLFDYVGIERSKSNRSGSDLSQY